MLQQTQVSVVREYFNRFVSRFPTVTDLAQAEETQVMQLWAGLGYYSRARNLHAAAKRVADVYGGVFPQTIQELTTLPGVGRSTAAAIASFCYAVPEPVLDGNVKRVLSRIVAVDIPVDSSAGEKIFLNLAKELTDLNEPGVYNQGMMDIGALLCTRTRPKCEHCPLANVCRAFLMGDQEKFPVKKPKRERSNRVMRLAFRQKDDAVWVVRRDQGDIWPGLWCLPEVSASADGKVIASVKRTLTHLNLTIEVLEMGDALALSDAGHWMRLEEIESAPFPTPIRSILKKLHQVDLFHQ